MTQSKHITVFKKELVSNVLLGNFGTYVDVTLGGGGHSSDLLNSLNSGRLVAFDIDSLAINSFGLYLKSISYKEISEGQFISPDGQIRVDLINSNFSEITDRLNSIEISKVDGIIADLGFSTDQLSNTTGLSYLSVDDELDMRMSDKNIPKAKDILNVYRFDQLSELFMTNGDFNYKDSQTLAKAIIASRKFSGVNTVEEFNNIINKAINTRNSVARAYQSLRIEVNNEYRNLNVFIIDCVNLLKEQSRLGVITFHSGEERILLESIKETKQMINITKDSDIRPSVLELRRNINARSAKLFIFEKQRK